MEMEISLKEIFQAILKRAGLISVITFLTVSLAAFYYYMIAVDEYTASTTLFIVNEKGEDAVTYNDILMGEKLVGDYKEIIISRMVLDAAGAKLGGIEIDKDAVSISSVNATRMIRLDVTDNDPQRAALIANAMAEEFSVSIKDIMRVETVNIIDSAKAPEEPSGPARTKNIAIAGLAALVLCCGVIVAITILDTTLRTREDVENYLKVPVLARVPALKKNQILVHANTGKGGRS